MQRFKPFLLFFAVLFFTAQGLQGQDVPRPEGFVNDFRGLMTASQKEVLNSFLNDFALNTSNEIAVVTLSLPSGETVETYTYKLAENWGVGGAENNGVVMAVFPDERKVRIEVGYGLEGILPDIVCNNIIYQYIVPQFRSGNYYQGIYDGVNIISQIAKGEFDTQSLRETYYDGGSSGELTGEDVAVIVLIIVIFVAIFLFAGIYGGGGGGGWGSGGGGYSGGGSYSSSSSWGSSGGGSFGGFSGGSFGGGGSTGGW
jgi:uncharacterized protein